MDWEEEFIIQEREDNRRYNLERIGKQYFIDPYGKIHRFSGDGEEEIISMHYEIACMLYPDLKEPEDFIMNVGWVMMGSSCYHTPIIYKKPTQAQINKLHDIEQYESLCFLYNDSYINYDKNQELCE